MTDNLPNYLAVETPDGKPFPEYTTHERRAYLCARVIESGDPYALNQPDEASRFSVHQSTISRDMDRIRESVGEHIGRAAKIRTASMLEWLTDELRDADDWRAKTALFDRVMRYNEWLADIGEQDREPNRSELDVRSRHSEVSYQVVREGDGEPLPETDAGGVDYAELGFTAAPGMTNGHGDGESDE